MATFGIARTATAWLRAVTCSAGKVMPTTALAQFGDAMHGQSGVAYSNAKASWRIGPQRDAKARHGEVSRCTV